MSNTIILMRHGHYADEQQARRWDLGDQETLTLQGRADVDDVARQMVEAGQVPDVIIHSPAPRTTETAFRMRVVFKLVSGRDIPVVADMNLADGYGIAAVKIFDNPACAGAKTILAISHEPNIAVFSGHLGDKIFAQKGQAIVFDAGGNAWENIPKSRPRAIFTPRQA